jgi:uncharacterized protein DUF87
VSKIHLGKGLSFERELATEVTGLIGMRGSGKSNAMGVVTEELLRLKVQVIILDYVGIHFSIRLDETGKHPSPYQIPVLGGQHGDIKLQPTAGRLIAESLVASGSSAVLDLTDFSKGDRCRFAADFAERLFECKRRNPGPCWLALEEAQRFVPQKILTGMEYLARMLGAFEEIAEVGRNFGLGLGLNTQRPQKIAKDVLNLADNVLAFRLNGVLERKAIAEWVQEKGAEGRAEVSGELPGLPRGTALVWSPNRGIYGKYALAKKTTYDAGSTPMQARAAVKMKALDLDELQASMATVVEESKANDPKMLKARIAELERALKAKPAVPGKTKTVEVPTVPKAVQAQVDELTSLGADGEKQLSTAIAQFDRLFRGLSKLDKMLGKVKLADDEPKSPPLRHSRTEVSSGRLVVSRPPAGNGHDPDAKVGAGERAILIACAQHGDGCTRQQLTVLTGYKRSTRDAYIQRLSVKGLIGISGDRVTASQEGIDFLGNDYKPLPTGTALLVWHLSNLPEGESKILRLLADAHPEPVDREAITEATGYKRSTRDAYIQRLSARQLVNGERGPVSASDTLFD